MRFEVNRLEVGRRTIRRAAVFVVVVFELLSSIAQTQSVAPVDEVSAMVQPRAGGSNNKPAISFASSGLSFSSQDGADQLRVHGYVQADDRMFSANPQGEALEVFLFRRMRPLFEGTLFNSIDFRFMPDFGQNNPQIQEAYLEEKSLSFAKLRVGKFKEPIGLEVLRSDRELTFAERSLASDLVPLRYMGAQVAGSVLSESITYAVGYFNGSTDGSNGSFKWIPANEAAARIFFRPFARTPVRGIRQFGLGLAGSSGAEHGTIVGLKTVGQSTFFKYSSTAIANGQHNRIAPQAYCYGGPVGLLGEYVISSQAVLNKRAADRLRNQAWDVSGSIVLTGEKNSYNGVRPRHAFEPTKSFRYWGAVELAARYSQLHIDRATFPLFANPKTAAQQATEAAIGLNWYLNRYVKLVTDYEHTSFKMALRSVTPLHNEDVLMSRIQLAF